MASEPGERSTIAASAAAAVIGLAAISRTKTPARGTPRRAVAAAVSHSSSRRLVRDSRTSVSPIACTMSHAS